MRIATWNVNSLNVRLEALLGWLERSPVGVVALQETKLTDDKFPALALRQAGYHVCYAGQKTYNGVALVSREEPREVLTALPGVDPEAKRFIAATVGGVRVVNVYVPNGQTVDSDKYREKLVWLDALESFLRQEMARHPRLVALGDFNIAPEDRDVHDPAAWAGSVLVSPPEREAFRRLLALPMVDCFRQVDGEGGRFSWWDYRAGSFRRNWGMRIDHLLASPEQAARLTGCHIDRAPRAWERPSDHTPVVAEFA
ncbi:MAG: exodeoxyribonuclease III [Magnetococcales bacterium]|nr:exodeoxyribonuclease III [Magnetococcales bacterium]